MGNRKFKLSNIIPTRFWLSRKSANTKPHIASKEQFPSKKALPVQTFDEMIILSSSSRSFGTEPRIPLYPETEHVLPRLKLSQPRRPIVSNFDNSPTIRKIHTKCCHGVKLKVKAKSPRINALTYNAYKANSVTPSSERSLSVTTVVNSSINAEADFKESMIEMIVENNITDFEGLEELLVSYLMLNSDEFHEVIVSVFKELVFGMFRQPKHCLG